MKKKLCLLLTVVMLFSCLSISATAYDYQTSAFWNVELIANHEAYIGTNVKDVQCYVRVNGTSSSTDTIGMYITNNVIFTNQPNLTRSNNNTYIPGTSSGNAAYANAAISDWGSSAEYSTSYSSFYFENQTLGITQSPSYMY